jgi:hypothetical protein
VKKEEKKELKPTTCAVFCEDETDPKVSDDLKPYVSILRKSKGQLRSAWKGLLRKMFGKEGKKKKNAEDFHFLRKTLKVRRMLGASIAQVRKTLIEKILEPTRKLLKEEAEAVSEGFNSVKQKKAVNLWEILTRKEILERKAKVIKRVNLLKETRELVNESITQVGKVLTEKVFKPAKDLLIKEAKARRKKLRRKWKKFVSNRSIEELKQATIKIERKRAWKEFEEQRRLTGQNMKKKIFEYVERAKQSKEILLSLFRSAANNIQIVVKEKVEVIRKERMIFEDMKEMFSSIDEIRMMKEKLH